MARPRTWRDTIPDCAPSECSDATTFGESLYQALLELDLIDEGQEAADCYTASQVRALRKWVHKNRLALAEYMGTTVDKIS